MLELPHVIVGATIATKIPNPLISLPLAFLSHVVLDTIPHWNPSLYTETKKYGRPSRKVSRMVALDLILSLGAGFFLASRVLPDFNHALIIILASFAAVILDVIEGFYFFLGVRTKFLKNLVEFQHHSQVKAGKIPGLLTQLAIILLSLFILNLR